MKKKLIKNILTLSVLALASLAHAETITGTLLVQAQVAGACSMNSDNINFGVVTLVDGKAGYATTTGSIRTTCTKDTEYTIKLGPGSAGTFGAGRKMTNGTNEDVLSYNLFSTSNLTTIWGDGTTGTYAVVKISDGTEQIENIQAQVPYDQRAKAGMYTDSLIITIDY